MISPHHKDPHSKGKKRDSKEPPGTDKKKYPREPHGKSEKKEPKELHSKSHEHKGPHKKEKKGCLKMWENVTSPNDIFSDLNDACPKSLKGKYSPSELIMFIHTIAEKMYHGSKLQRVEKEAWDCSSKAIKAELRTPNCNLFFAGREQEWATCCRVLVADEYFAFCTYLRILGISEARSRNLFLSKSDQTLSVARSQAAQSHLQRKFMAFPGLAILGSLGSAYREFLSRAYFYTADFLEPVTFTVMYVDLFDVPCYPPLDLGLCSQFVSTALRSDHC